MPIVRRYGDPGDIAQLGAMAGQARGQAAGLMEKRRRQAQQAALLASVIASQQQAYAAEASRAERAAAQTRSLLHQKEMTRFRAQVDLAGQQQAYAWELQKMGMRSQHDLAMEFQKEEILRQREIQKQIENEEKYEIAERTILERFNASSPAELETMPGLSEENRELGRNLLNKAALLYKHNLPLNVVQALVPAVQKAAQTRIPTYDQAAIMGLDIDQLGEMYRDHYNVPAPAPSPSAQMEGAGFTETPMPSDMITGGGIPQPQTEAEYNALPIGATYMHPDGSIRTKR